MTIYIPEADDFRRFASKSKSYILAEAGLRRLNKIANALATVVIIILGVYLLVNSLGALGLAAPGITTALATLGLGGGMLVGLMVLVGIMLVAIKTAHYFIDKVFQKAIDRFC